MKKFIFIFICIGAIFPAKSQCGTTVPSYSIDLTGAPDSVWTLLGSNASPRQGQCCGAPGSQKCISFEVIPDANCGAIYFNYEGAGAFGTLNWRIDCGPAFNLTDTICITDDSPFTLTFCKPGNDNGDYTLISVPKPTFPEDQFVPLNCIEQVEIFGINASTVWWNSVVPDPDGSCNNYLSCTNCLSTIFTPESAGPDYISYQACGYPILPYCVGNTLFCDTISFTIQDSLDVSVSDVVFCQGGSAAVTGSASGGDGNYAYYWYNSAMVLVGTGPTFTTTVPGTYTIEVRDGHYEPGVCGGFFDTFTVSMALPPIVSAGNDQDLCSTSPIATLSGSIQNLSTGFWNGGAGAYLDSSSDLTLTYVPTQAEIDAGSVTLTLTSENGTNPCPVDSDEVTVFFADTIETNLADFVLDCPYSTVTVNPVVTGGLPPLSYLWSTGSTATSATLGAGTYCLNLTDQNGCIRTDCFTVAAPDALNLALSSTPVTTNGGSDGTATVTPDGGISPYTYSWSNGSASPTISALPYGIYTVTVTDNNGCQMTGSTVVNHPFCNGFYATSSATPVSCFGGSTGSATITPVNGTAPFFIDWNDSGNQTTGTAINLSAGVYSATITDANGCVASGTVAVTEPTQLDNTFTFTNSSTLSGSDGSVQTNVSGGTLPYTYSWSNGAVTPGCSNIAAGWYAVSIADGNGCTLTDSVYINEPPCKHFSVHVNSSSLPCNGATGGTANVVVMNGTGPFNISWSSGQTNVTAISGLQAGLYSVQVSDAQNCYGFTSFTITEPSPLTAQLLINPSTCYELDNGTINLVVSGGTFPGYSFLWDDGYTNEDRVQLDPGTYSVTITDNNNCSATAAGLMTEPGPLNAFYTIAPISCFGGMNGGIDMTVEGGSPVLTYNWSNSATAEDLSGLGAGGYVLSVTDGNFCTLPPLTVPLSQPPKVNIDSITVNCPLPGNSMTPVNVYASGGTAGYAVSYNNSLSYGAYGDLSENLAVDNTYNVILKDINNCLSDVYPLAIDSNVTALVIDYELCYPAGQTTETVTVTPAGGTGTYSLSTNNGLTFNPTFDYDFVLPIDANYQLLVKDSKGCLSQVYNVSLPAVLATDVTITSNYNGAAISCFGYADGAIASATTGGVTPYNYLWNTGATGSVMSGLLAGTYTLLLTDANNCQVSDNITLNNPSVLVSQVSVTSDYNGEMISCYNSTDGEATVFASGGTGSYSYAWSNGQTAATAAGLASGSYSVTVYDVNLCSSTGSVFLTEPDAIVLDPVVTDVMCYGENSGAIDITPAGGLFPYNFQWSNGATTEDLAMLNAGTYSLTLVDDNFCTESLTLILTEPAEITIDEIIVNCPLPGDSITQVDINVPGLAAGYAASFNNSLSYGPYGNLSANLAVDNMYDIVVKDTNNCMSDVFTIMIDTTLVAAELKFDVCYVAGQTTETVVVIPAGGSGTYTISTDNGTTFIPVSDFDPDLPINATYQLVISDSKGCLSEVYNVVLPAILSTDAYVSSNYNGAAISCFGYSDGAVASISAGGTLPYAWTWNTTATGPGISGLPSGTYTLVLTDANNCEVTDSVSLVDPPALTAAVTVSSNYNGEMISCHGFANGEATAFPVGGTGSYSYTWSDGQVSQAAGNLASGNYSVTVYDVNLCSSTQTVFLTEPDTIVISNVIQDVSCNGGHNGAIDVTATGGTSPYAYQWSNGAETEDISALSAGNYNLALTDANNCPYNLSGLVVDPTPIDLQLVTGDAPCYGMPGGWADLTVAGGSPPYSYDWNNAETVEDINQLQAGTYTVTVKDANGCWTLISGIVDEPDKLAIVSTVQDVRCYGERDGAIAITPSGGIPGYNCSWSNGKITTHNNKLGPGNYLLTLTDVNGCLLEEEFVINQPDSLWASLTSSLNHTGYNISEHGGNDGSIDLTVNGGTAPYAYSWSNGSTAQNLHDLPAGHYAVTIIDNNGCKYAVGDSLIEPGSLQMPTAISPNGDHQNDYFVVRGLDAYPDNNLVITGRWGNVIYEQQSYQNNWDGTNMNGEALPEGVYFAILEIDNGAITLKGYIELKRK
jgi:gliding motility-associated-like protein